MTDEREMLRELFRCVEGDIDSLADAVLHSDWLAAHTKAAVDAAVEAAAVRVETLEEFGRLPVGTIVHKTWPYQGENAEPEVWLRPNAATTWVEISDPSGWEDRCAVDVAYHDAAIQRVVYQPARVVRDGGDS